MNKTTKKIVLIVLCMTIINCDKHFAFLADAVDPVNLKDVAAPTPLVQGSNTIAFDPAAVPALKDVYLRVDTKGEKGFSSGIRFPKDAKITVVGTAFSSKVEKFEAADYNNETNTLIINSPGSIVFTASKEDTKSFLIHVKLNDNEAKQDIVFYFLDKFVSVAKAQEAFSELKFQKSQTYAISAKAVITNNYLYVSGKASVANVVSFVISLNIPVSDLSETGSHILNKFNQIDIGQSTYIAKPADFKDTDFVYVTFFAENGAGSIQIFSDKDLYISAETQLPPNFLASGSSLYVYVPKAAVDLYINMDFLYGANKFKVALFDVSKFDKTQSLATVANAAAEVSIFKFADEKSYVVGFTAKANSAFSINVLTSKFDVKTDEVRLAAIKANGDITVASAAAVANAAIKQKLYVIDNTGAKLNAVVGTEAAKDISKDALVSISKTELSTKITTTEADDNKKAVLLISNHYSIARGAYSDSEQFKATAGVEKEFKDSEIQVFKLPKSSAFNTYTFKGKDNKIVSASYKVLPIENLPSEEANKEYLFVSSLTQNTSFANQGNSNTFTLNVPGDSAVESLLAVKFDFDKKETQKLTINLSETTNSKYLTIFGALVFMIFLLF